MFGLVYFNIFMLSILAMLVGMSIYERIQRKL